MEKGKLIGKGRSAEIYAWGSDRVLKLYFDWYPEGWAEYEAVAQRIVHEAGVPSPEVDGTVQVEGRHGVIMERIDGPTMLDELQKRPWRLSHLAGMLAELQAATHNCQAHGLEKARIKLWGEIAQASSIPHSAKEFLMSRLVGLPDGNAVCHYDFHPMNVIMSPRGPVIIDWGGACAGDPALDVARTWLLLIRAVWPFGFPYNILITPMRGLFYAAYFRRYQQLHSAYTIQLEEWRQVLIAARLGENIPEENDRLLSLLRIPGEAKHGT